LRDGREWRLFWILKNTRLSGIEQDKTKRMPEKHTDNCHGDWRVIGVNLGDKKTTFRIY